MIIDTKPMKEILREKIIYRADQIVGAPGENQIDSYPFDLKQCVALVEAINLVEDFTICGGVKR